MPPSGRPPNRARGPSRSAVEGGILEPDHVRPGQRLARREKRVQIGVVADRDVNERKVEVAGAEVLGGEDAGSRSRGRR